MNDHIQEPADNQARVREHVIDVAIQAFHREGIKGVTMDDISHRLTMSKRTLYQIFADKEELLLACIIKHQGRQRAEIEEVMKHSDNVLDRLLTIFALHMREMEGITPNFFREFYKYPRVIAHFDADRKLNEQRAIDFLNRGIEQGFFRSEVKFKIVYNYLVNGMREFLECSEYEGFTQKELFANTVLISIRGCCTQKGLEIIDGFLDKYADRFE